MYSGGRARMNREKWLDCIKIVASFLVIVLHVTNYGLDDNISSRIHLIYYLGVYAIPLFFMVNGYLQLRKKEITYKYCIKKIIKILFVVFMWNLFIIIAYIILKNEYKNIFCEMFKNLFMQKGFFNYFWFFGALIILYLLLPIISKIFNSKKYYLGFTLALVFISCIIDILNITSNYYAQEVIMNKIYQPLRIWSWLMYFSIGGVLSKIDFLNIIGYKKFKIVTVALVILGVLYEYLFSYRLYGNLYAENFYDSIIIIIGATFIFSLFKNIKFSENNNFIDLSSNLIMGIYIVQPIVIKIIRYIIPLGTDFFNVLAIFLVYIISLCTSYIISKTPKLKTLIKL